MTENLTNLAMDARAGNVQAAEAFVRSSQAEVWRLLAALTDAAHADDLTQETYLRAFRSLPRFRGDASARTWLLRVARNTAADHLRSRRRRPSPEPLPDPATTPAALVTDPLGQIADRLSAHEALAALDGERREAFVLTSVLGLTYAQAAEVVGCPVGTIRSRVARAREHLVHALLDEDSRRGRTRARQDGQAGAARRDTSQPGR